MNTEHDIQNAIQLELSRRGYFVERINVGEGFLIRKPLLERIKAAVRRSDPALYNELSEVRYFRTGAVNGRTDLSAVKGGRMYYIEVKKPGGRVRDDQKHFISVMQDRYHTPAGIARSVEDALEIVGEEDCHGNE